MNLAAARSILAGLPRKHRIALFGNRPGSADAPAGRQPYWEVRDLAVIGIFSALTKVASLMVALVGGGMNPLTLILKNMVFTAMLIILLFKVHKFGTLILFIVVNTLFAMLLMGGAFFLLPAILIAGLCAEGLILALGGYQKPINLMVAVAVYDLMYKAGSLGIAWVFVREQPQVLWMATLMVAVGYSGALAGLFIGAGLLKELRHAGIVRQ
jgi:energy-coupling factor transport system substrate-specific component